jgi:hypothetical protein
VASWRRHERLLTFDLILDEAHKTVGVHLTPGDTPARQENKTRARLRDRNTERVFEATAAMPPMDTRGDHGARSLITI